MKSNLLGIPKQGLVDSNSIVSGWNIYPMVIGAVTTAPTKGTVTRDIARWRRVGTNMEISYQYNQSGAGANGSGRYNFPLPNGYHIDTTLLTLNPQSTDTTTGYCGQGNAGTATAEFVIMMVAGSTDTSLQMMYHTSFDTFTGVGSAAIGLGGASIHYNWTASIPIREWAF